MEEWKDIKGYEGLYQISNKGRVKSLAKEIITNNGYSVCVKKYGEKILKPHHSVINQSTWWGDDKKN